MLWSQYGPSEVPVCCQSDPVALTGTLDLRLSVSKITPEHFHTSEQFHALSNFTLRSNFTPPSKDALRACLVPKMPVSFRQWLIPPVWFCSDGVYQWHHWLRILSACFARINNVLLFLASAPQAEKNAAFCISESGKLALEPSAPPTASPAATKWAKSHHAPSNLPACCLLPAGDVWNYSTFAAAPQQKKNYKCMTHWRKSSAGITSGDRFRRHP